MSDEKNTSSEEKIIDAEVIDERPNAASGAQATLLSPEPAGKSFLARAGWYLALLLAAFIGGIFAAPYFEAGLIRLGVLEHPQPASDAAGPGTVNLEAELEPLRAALVRQQEMLAQHEKAIGDAANARAALSDRLSALPEGGTGQGADSTAPEALLAMQQQLDRLTADIARLSSLAGTPDPSVGQLTGALALARAEAKQLADRMEGLEAAMKAVQVGAIEASPRGRLVLALGRIKERATLGQPFAAELAALRPDFALLPALDQQRIGADLAYLEDRATGLWSYDQLVREFGPMASAVVTATEKASGGFLTGLFTVRRTDAGATGVDAILLKAERSLTARDIPGAVDALATLEGPAAEAVTVWLSAARDYAGANAAFDRLMATASREAPTSEAKE